MVRDTEARMDTGDGRYGQKCARIPGVFIPGVSLARPYLAGAVNGSTTASNKYRREQGSSILMHSNRNLGSRPVIIAWRPNGKGSRVPKFRRRLLSAVQDSGSGNGVLPGFWNHALW